MLPLAAMELVLFEVACFVLFQQKLLLEFTDQKTHDP